MDANQRHTHSYGAGHKGSPAKEIPHNPLAPLDDVAIVVSCHRGALLRRRDLNDCLCRTISGVIAESVVRADGHRQIIDLLFPGDFFLCPNGEKQDATALEAVARSTSILGYPCRYVDTLAGADPRLGREIRNIGWQAANRLSRHILVLTYITTDQKLALFIEQLAERFAEQDGSGVTLPITRNDIADYLGVSVETVSRAFTKLQNRGVISMAGARCIRAAWCDN